MKILVVDDNIDLAEMIGSQLAAQGHDVVTVHDGESAIRAIEASQVDALVLDLSLPDISGYDVALKLRNGILQREAVIALYTGEGPSFDSAASVGIDLVVRKPMEPAELGRLLVFLYERRQKQLART